jgi:hypothetical protein
LRNLAVLWGERAARPGRAVGQVAANALRLLRPTHRSQSFASAK